MNFTVEPTGKNRCCWTVEVTTQGDTVKVYHTGQAKLSSRLVSFASKHKLDAHEMVKVGQRILQEQKGASDGPTKLWGRVRAIEDKDSEAISVTSDSVRGLLAKLSTHKASVESVFKFGPVRSIAALDVDYHHTTPPTRPECLRLCAMLQPRPVAIWVTHGNGIRAVYEATATHDAEEVAACAAIFMKQLDPRCKAEILDTSRHPLSVRTKNGTEQRCSPVNYAEQDIDGLRGLWTGESTGTATADQIDEWLTERGMTFGRHDHDKCPFDNSEMQTGAPPVLVTPDGIKCFKCAGQGHPTNGYITWDRLLTGRTTPRIVDCAKNWIHWEHAKLVMLEDYGSMGLGERILRKAYSSLLKLLHDHDDPRLKTVFRPFGLVRSAQNTWLDPLTLNQILPAPKQGRFQRHPACTSAWLDEDGAWQKLADQCEIDKFCVVQKLPNWPGVKAVRGFRIWGKHREYANRDEVRALAEPRFKPRYLSESQRAPSAEIDRELRRCFPLINVDYLRLLIVARGHAEYGKGRPPIIVATGPTGCGKTQTLELAAHIIGETVAELPKDAKFEIGMGQSFLKGGFVLCDEYAKNPQWTPAKRSSEFDKFLPINERFSYRELYVGVISVPVNSAIVIANNAYGAEVTEHKQFGRRAVHVALNRSVPADKDWTLTCGTGSISEWRSNERNAYIADSLLSELIDMFFAPGVASSYATFEQDASVLGFETYAASRNDHGVQSNDVDIREFFRLVCAHKFESKRDRQKIIDLSQMDLDIVVAWGNICDRDHRGQVLGSSMKLSESSLVDVLGVECGPDEGIFVSSHRKGSRLYVKFKLAKRKNGKGLVNEEIPIKASKGDNPL